MRHLLWYLLILPFIPLVLVYVTFRQAVFIGRTQREYNRMKKSGIELDDDVVRYLARTNAKKWRKGR